MLMSHLKNALINSLHGLRQTWQQEKAFRLEIIGCVFVLFMTFWIEAPKTDKFFVIFSLSLVLMTELLNTALEKANDACKREKDPLIKFSKDAASASVFIALCLGGLSFINLFF
jgi:diacylglycerol kinase (ATP)